MQNATVDRLAKLITDQPPENSSGKDRRVPQQARNIFAHLHLAEGWFSFFLLALVVYSTIWCVQVVGWVDHIGLLTPLTALGLLGGVIAAKQQRVPRALMHILAVLLAPLLAFWQTSNADLAGQWLGFFHSIRTPFALPLARGTQSDE